LTSSVGSAAFLSIPMPRWKTSASAIALWLAAGWVPISSNFRTSSSCFFSAGMSGQILPIFDRRT